MDIRSFFNPPPQGHVKVGEPDIISSEQVGEWPGTKLLSGTATLHRLRLSPRLQNLLSTSATSLASWIQPNLPEDPAFYREDGSLLMGSVSHEQDVFLELTADEEAELSDLIPPNSN